MRTYALGPLCFAVCVVAAAASSALPTTASGMLALVKATPQLEIDPTLPNPSGDKSSPWVRVKHSPEGTNGGYILAGFAQRGTLSDGTHALAIPLDSGGSGAVFTQLIFDQRSGGAARYVGYLSSGGHLGVHVSRGALVAEYPDYAANDAQCCPSHYLHQKYSISNGRLHLVSTWRTAKM
jgi:hypothetical protein